MTEGTTHPDQARTEICGYPVDSSLSDKGCYLAIGPGGRGVVVKRMEDNCLLKGQLHPAVRDRLGPFWEYLPDGDLSYDACAYSRKLERVAA